MTPEQLTALRKLLYRATSGELVVERVEFDKFASTKDVVVQWTTRGLAAMQQTISPGGSTISQRLAP